MNHRTLEQQAYGALKTLYEDWANLKRVAPFLLTWPQHPIPDQSGVPIGGTIRLELADVPKKFWSRDIREAVEITSAVALLLCEQLEDHVLVVLESRFGTTSWRLPIQQRGDVQVLGQSSTHFNIHNVGILWRTVVGSA